MISIPSSKRARLSSILSPNVSNSLGIKARPKPTSQTPVADVIQHGKLTRQLDRVIEGRDDGAGDGSDTPRAGSDGREENNRIWGVATIGVEVVAPLPWPS